MRIFLIIIFILISLTVKSQDQSRVDSIKSALILPINISECFQYLDIIITSNNLDNESILSYWHFGMGLWIRNNWIAKNPKLWSYFKSYGLSDPDRISGFIESGYKEFSMGKIEDPEIWIAQQKNERDNFPLIIDGKELIMADRKFPKSENIKQIDIINQPNKLQYDLRMPCPSIQIMTKKGFAKTDRKLITLNQGYSKLRKLWDVESIIFIYKLDTIKFADLVGNENKLYLIPDNNLAPNINIKIKALQKE